MCVILSGAANKIYPLLDKAMDANPDGNGLAWVDNTSRGITVRWYKGVSNKDSKNLVKALGSTLVVFHARIATVGGTTSSLCHPFPVELRPKLDLYGKDEMVLFHNGHYSSWEKLVPEGELKKHEESWSDSRAVAHGLASGAIKTEDLGGNVNGVYALLSTDPFEGKAGVGTVRYFGSWTHIGEGVQASNRNFLTPSRYYYLSKYRHGRYGYLYEDADDFMIPYYSRFDENTKSTSVVSKYDYDGRVTIVNPDRTIPVPINEKKEMSGEVRDFDLKDRHSYRYSG